MLGEKKATTAKSLSPNRYCQAPWHPLDQTLHPMTSVIDNQHIYPYNDLHLPPGIGILEQPQVLHMNVLLFCFAVSSQVQSTTISCIRINA